MARKKKTQKIFNDVVNDYLNSVGLELNFVSISGNDLIKNGFKKVEDELFPDVSSFLQQLPFSVDTIVRSSDSDNCVRLYRDGKKVSYKLLQRVKGFDANNPKYRANILGDTLINNDISGQAELVPLSVSYAPVVASSLFSIASYATGQYYLKQINSSISEIKDSVNKILQFVQIDKRSQLGSRMRYLEYVHKNIASIISNDFLKSTVLSELQSIRIYSYADYTLYDDLINSEIQVLQSKEKVENISDSIGQICDWIALFYNAMSLYIYTIFLETILFEPLDSDYYQYIKNEIEDTITCYNEKIDSFSSTIDDSLNKASAYKNNESILRVAQVAFLPTFPLFFPIAIAGEAILNDIKQDVKADNEKHRNSMKTKLQELLVGYVKNCDNTKSLEDLGKNIELLDKFNNGVMEYVITPDGSYLKIE